MSKTTTTKVLTCVRCGRRRPKDGGRNAQLCIDCLRVDGRFPRRHFGRIA